MRVFVDTNVLVAAYATRGLCADLLRLILAQHELVVSRQVLDELERALRDKIGLPEALIAEILATLAAHLFETEPGLRSPLCSAIPLMNRSSRRPSPQARRRSSPVTPTSSTPPLRRRCRSSVPALSGFSCAAAEG